MRWKSEVKHAELTPARTWSKRDEGNFGGRSILTPESLRSTDIPILDEESDAIEHYGIKGQKWGLRRFQYENGSYTPEGKERYTKVHSDKEKKSPEAPPNTKRLENYSGKAYFVSPNNDIEKLDPRVPKNYFTDNGYEDSSTPRISFAPSINQCLAGLSQNLDGKSFCVYEPDDISSYAVFKPNAKAVPDSSITDELWICEPVKLKKVCDIQIVGNEGKDGKSFKYGDQVATLYDDWLYEIKHSFADEKDSLAHYGVPGMKWGVTTKEYIKKGYNTLKRRQAILKQKRKAEAKAQFEEGYHRGQRVASNLSFIKTRVDDVMRRKKQQEEGSLSDRAVNKAFDYALKKTQLDKTAKMYGLDQYIPQAKDFLKGKKDDLVDNLYDYLQSDDGQKRLAQFANFMGRGVSGSVRAGYSVARIARKGGQIAKQAVKSGVKTAAKAVGSSAKSGYKWLRTGNPTGAQKIKRKVRSGEKFISKLGDTAATTIQRGAETAHRGAKSAHKQLNQLLNRRHRRA